MSPLLKAEALLLLRTFLKTGFVCLAVHKKYLLIMGGGGGGGGGFFNKNYKKF